MVWDFFGIWGLGFGHFAGNAAKEPAPSMPILGLGDPRGPDVPATSRIKTYGIVGCERHAGKATIELMAHGLMAVRLPSAVLRGAARVSVSSS